nr:hypothetical protein [Tanacetum cinerariifolium]
MADFHHLDDAREIWLAVKARFGGNEESKKMRKTMLKQSFLEFSVFEEEGLHKGYDRFQKILSQLNQMQAKPNNDDVNIKFLRALPPSWSLEIDVKGGSSYGSRSTTIAPTHSAFIGAVSTNTKMVYSDQPSYSSLISYTLIPSGSIMNDVLHSFIVENKPTQQLAYEDFKQVDQLEMEKLDIKWKMAMLSLRINKFQKKAGRKINFNNKDSARFKRRKARCYNCLHLGHFARECNVKKVDEKARYSAFKISEVKTEEPKAMVFVDSMLNWNEHDEENKTKEAEQVYGLMARFELDFAVHAGNAAGGVNHAAAEFAMMGISPKVQTYPFGCDSKLSNLKQNYEHLENLYNDFFIQVQAHKNTVQTLELQKYWYHQTQLALEEKVRILSANLKNITNTLKYSKTLYAQAKFEKHEWEIKFVESLARFDKWQESSKNQAKLLYSSMSTRTKLGLGFKEYIGSDEVCDQSTPNVFDLEPDNKKVKSLYERFVKAGKMHDVPPLITGTFMPTSYQSDIAETQATFGLKSNTSSIPTFESNDFVSCDNSDKSSVLETYDFASCVSSPKTNDSFPTVDVKLLLKSDIKDSSLTNGLPSCSFKENVKPLRNLCNKSGTADRIPCKKTFVRTKKCFVCGSKSHLIKDCIVHDNVDNFPSVVSKAASVPAGKSIHAGKHIPAGRINKRAPFPAGSSVLNGWTNPAARPFFRPTNLYFDNVHPHVNKDIGIVDSGCSRSMIGNKEKLNDFVQVKGDTVTFGDRDAEIEIRMNLVPAAGDPAGSIVSTGGVPAGSVTASCVLAGSVPASSVPAGKVLAGSIVSTGGVPAGSVTASCVLAGSVPASSVPAGKVLAGSIVSTGGVPAGSVPASGVPAGSVPASSIPTGGVLAGSIVSAEFGDLAASASVPAVLTNAPAATSPLPPGHSLGSCEHTTRFPSPSDLGNHQPTTGIFSSSFYDADFCVDVTNLASTVAVDPVATKRDPDWVAAMQEEMQQFYNQQVWKLVPLPDGKIAIGTKWILKNKRDARGIVVRNKARLVAQGHRQEKGIIYDEVFASVARIEAI